MKQKGLGDPEAEAANELAAEAAFLARVVAVGGGHFSIEFSWDSRVWEMRCRKALLKLDPVRLVRGDACGRGSLHRKPAGFMTNAPWITDLPCDLRERPHVHVPLEGKVFGCCSGAS